MELGRSARRGFFKLLGGATAALLLLRPRLAFAGRIAIALDKIAPVKTGGAVKLKVKEQPLLIVRDREGGIHAIDPTCTHKKCQIDYSSETRQLHCKCHKSAYALDGTVLAGPAPKPLTVFKASIEGERVIIELPDEKKE